VDWRWNRRKAETKNRVCHHLCILGPPSPPLVAALGGSDNGLGVSEKVRWEWLVVLAGTVFCSLYQAQAVFTPFWSVPGGWARLVPTTCLLNLFCVFSSRFFVWDFSFVFHFCFNNQSPNLRAWNIPCLLLGPTLLPFFAKGGWRKCAGSHSYNKSRNVSLFTLWSKRYINEQNCSDVHWSGICCVWLVKKKYYLLIFFMILVAMCTIMSKRNGSLFWWSEDSVGSSNFFRRG